MTLDEFERRHGDSVYFSAVTAEPRKTFSNEMCLGVQALIDGIISAERERCAKIVLGWNNGEIGRRIADQIRATGDRAEETQR